MEINNCTSEGLKILYSSRNVGTSLESAASCINTKKEGNYQVAEQNRINRNVHYSGKLDVINPLSVSQSYTMYNLADMCID